MGIAIIIPAEKITTALNIFKDQEDLAAEKAGRGGVIIVGDTSPRANVTCQTTGVGFDVEKPSNKDEN